MHSKSLHALQRGLEATIRYRLLPRDERARIARALDALRPYRTGHDLIRVGPDGDGGYLVPDCLDGLRASFSPGVSEEYGFDLDLMRRGVPVHMADASVAPPADLPDLATFEPLFLGAQTGGDWITLDDWVSRHAPGSGDLLLQMDIEGHEYDVLANTGADTLRRFRVMVIEFHGLHRISRKSHLSRMERALGALAEDFVCVHLHPNNVVLPVRVGPHRISPCFEATLLRRDQVTQLSPNDSFPHPLDHPNVADAPDVPLGRFWS